MKGKPTFSSRALASLSVLAVVTITISNPSVYEGDGNSIYTTSDTRHYNDTHANKMHKIVYTITIDEINSSSEEPYAVITINKK